MIVTTTSVVDVPAAAGTLLTDQDSPAAQRTFVFKNLNDPDDLALVTLSLLIEESSDGGATWETNTVAFNVEAGTVEIKNVISTNILRVRGSGGTDDRDLEFSLVKIYTAPPDSSHVITRSRV